MYLIANDFFKYRNRVLNFIADGNFFFNLLSKEYDYKNI